jgi:hypothetical protein
VLAHDVGLSEQLGIRQLLRPFRVVPQGTLDGES